MICPFNLTVLVGKSSHMIAVEWFLLDGFFSPSVSVFREFVHVEEIDNFMHQMIISPLTRN